MNETVSISVTSDTATPEINRVIKACNPRTLSEAVGAKCYALTKEWMYRLPHNKQGWAPIGFYTTTADAVTWSSNQNSAVINVDNPNAPGAIAFRYNRGEAGNVTINAKEKLLTIPAREEAYGHKATEFTNLKFVMFHSGAKALVVGPGGSDLYNFATGKEKKGVGPRSAALVMYWLKSSVVQQADPSIIPPKEAYVETSIAAIKQVVANRERIAA